MKVPESIRFELVGTLDPGCTAKDVILFILADHARKELTLNRSMEFGGPGLASLSMDERATLCNMATECSARTGICEADDATVEWMLARRPDQTRDMIEGLMANPDPGAIYDGGTFVIDLSSIQPMVAHPGDPDLGIPSDPTNGALITDIGDVQVNIAYGGSCTAGKIDDIAYYAQVCAAAESAGLSVKDGVEFFIQYGSGHVKSHAQTEGWHDLFQRVGVKIIDPDAAPALAQDQASLFLQSKSQCQSDQSKLSGTFRAGPLVSCQSTNRGHICLYREDFRLGTHGLRSLKLAHPA